MSRIYINIGPPFSVFDINNVKPYFALISLSFLFEVNFLMHFKTISHSIILPPLLHLVHSFSYSFVTASRVFLNKNYRFCLLLNVSNNHLNFFLISTLNHFCFSSLTVKQRWVMWLITDECLVHSHILSIYIAIV